MFEIVCALYELLFSEKARVGESHSYVNTLYVRYYCGRRKSGSELRIKVCHAERSVNVLLHLRYQVRVTISNRELVT
jgi:hypothetical protein